MPDPVNFNDRVLLVGKTQTGKSTFTRYLASQMRGARMLLVNVKAQEEVGVEPVRDVAAIDWAAPVVDFIPPTMDGDVFEELYREIFEHGGPRVVWLDEAFGPTRAGWAPTYLRVIQQQGARRGIGHFYCSQRPQGIATELKSECEHIFVFGTVFTRRDLDALAAEMGMSGDALGERLRAVHDEHGDYAFLWYARRSGELVDCAPLAPEWAGAVLVAD